MDRVDRPLLDRVDRADLVDMMIMMKRVKVFFVAADFVECDFFESWVYLRKDAVAVENRIRPSDSACSSKHEKE